MVLYVFVVAYVGGESEAIGERLRGPGGAAGGLELRLGAARSSAPRCWSSC